MKAPINKGTTWVWEMKFWDDAAKTIPKDVSTHSFAWTLRDPSGVTIMTLANSRFVQVAANHRKVTLSNIETAPLPICIGSCELNVTLPTSEVQNWEKTFVSIEE